MRQVLRRVQQEHRALQFRKQGNLALEDVLQRGIRAAVLAGGMQPFVLEIGAAFTAAPRTFRADAGIHHDAVHPGVEARFAPERPDAAVHVHEGLLETVFGILAVAVEAVGQRVERGFPAVVQLPEGKQVAPRAAVDQPFVRIGKGGWHGVCLNGDM